MGLYPHNLHTVLVGNDLLYNEYMSEYECRYCFDLPHKHIDPFDAAVLRLQELASKRGFTEVKSLYELKQHLKEYPEFIEHT